jgi:protein-disulfide isomerase
MRPFVPDLRLALLLPLLLAAPLAPPAAAQPFTPEQRAGIVDIMRDALRTDPSILRDAIAALQAAEAQEAQAQQAQAMASMQAQLLKDPDDPVIGNPGGDVTIVEFFDYRCSYCRRAHPEVRALLAHDRGVRYVAKELPILGPASLVAARVALAAHRQGKWEAVNHALMRFTGEPTEANLLHAATAAGADAERLRRDMADPAIARHITRTNELARALGVTGTPAFVIGGQLVPGAVDQAELRRLVAAARAAR